MRRSTLRISVVTALILFSVEATAQSAFIEGHVFNLNSGKPLPRAVVEIHENVTLGPVPIELGEDVTDGNGFYEVEITEFLGYPASIRVTCRCRRASASGTDLPRIWLGDPPRGHAAQRHLPPGACRAHTLLPGRDRLPAAGRASMRDG